MIILPPFDDFAAAYGRGQAQVVSTRLVSDLETPVSVMLKLARNSAYGFLLESVEGGAVRGRYSMIGLKPDLIWRVEGAKAEINRKALADPDGPFKPLDGDPLAALRDLIAESRIEVAEDLPPMAAGLFGYIGYDMVRLMENLPAVNPDTLGLPDAILVRPTIMAIFDSVRDEVTVVTPVYPAPDVSAKAAYARASERLHDVIDAFDRPLDLLAHAAPDAPPISEPRSNTSPDDYMAMVGRAKDYIAAGDIFQVVLSQRFETEFTLPPFALYRALRRVNPSPFLYFLDFGASPSSARARKFSCGCATARSRCARSPARGGAAPPAEDRALGEELLADPKERAEHLMLLDLGRNDVGRVAEDRHGQGHRKVRFSNTTARSCTSSRTSRASSIRATTPSTR
jgi:anthranilate synthase component I